MEESQPMFELQVDQTVSKSLVDAARWARFIAVFMFAGMACVILLMFAFKDRIASVLANYLPAISRPESFQFFLIFLFVVVLILTVLMVFLLRGAILIKRGIETKNQFELVEGLRSLKIYFAIYSILAIIGAVANLIGLILK